MWLQLCRYHYMILIKQRLVDKIYSCCQGSCSKKDNSCPMYHLPWKSCVLVWLYHPSNMISTELSQSFGSGYCFRLVVRFVNDRKAAASMYMVCVQGIHLGCGCKSDSCHTGKSDCMKTGAECNSRCHGGTKQLFAWWLVEIKGTP